jgi:multidrug resistance efflux pump
MLLILALIYAGFVWLAFYKLRLMEFTRTRQIIVAGIGVIVIMAIWFTIQRTSPMTSNLRVSTYVIPIGSRSGGRVTQVYVKGSQTVKTGDKLFEVDSDPYRYDVESLKGALVDAEQKARQLPPNLDSARASVIQRQKDLAVAEMAASQAEKDIAQTQAAIEQGKKNVEVARLSVKQRELDLALAQSTLDRVQKAFNEGGVAAQDLDSAKAKRDVSQESLKQAADQQAVAELNLEQAIRNKEMAELSLKQSLEKVTLSEQAIRQAKNQQDIALLNLNSMVNGENSSVVQVKANLAGAEWKLKESIVYAPANGFIPEVQLKEGFIAGLNQPVLSLVSTDNWWIYGLYEQSRLGLVEPGDVVELIFRFYPGRVFRGKVEHIIRAVGQGQLPVNGMVTPVTPSQSDLQLFAVKVTLDEESLKALPLNLGATGEMVILTKHVTSFHIIGRIMLRMSMWMYYLGF